MAKLLESDPSPVKGPSTATTLVEFSDFQCPYCKQLANYLTRARQEGIQLRVVFKQLPLPQHSWARQAAVLSSCAERQSKDAFWAVHDFLFEYQDALSPSTIKDRVWQLFSTRHDIDLPMVGKCADDNQVSEVLQADQQLAQEFHVKETPTVFINGARKLGFTSFEDFLRSIGGSEQQEVTTAASK